MKVLIYDVDFTSSGVKYPILNAFEELGHKAEMFDWSKYLFSNTHPNRINFIKDRLLFDLVAKRINDSLKRLIKDSKFDCLLVVRGEHIFPETLLYAKKYISVIANWSSDDLFNKLNSSRHILNSIDKYDIHFSPRKHLKEEYINKGARAFEIIDWYYRPETLQYTEKTSKYANNICFVGSWSARREGILTSISSYPLTLCGWGWNKKLNSSKFLNWNISAPIQMSEMMNIFSKTKININILTIENRDRINPRNYDIAIAGGFQLSERSEAVSEVFEEDKDIVCFGSPDELASKCDYYLKNEEARKKIALAGEQKILNGNNRLLDRVREIADKIKGYA